MPLFAMLLLPELLVSFSTPACLVQYCWFYDLSQYSPFLRALGRSCASLMFAL